MIVFPFPITVKVAKVVSVATCGTFKVEKKPQHHNSVLLYSVTLMRLAPPLTLAWLFSIYLYYVIPAVSY